MKKKQTQQKRQYKYLDREQLLGKVLFHVQLGEGIIKSFSTINGAERITILFQDDNSLRSFPFPHAFLLSHEFKKDKTVYPMIYDAFIKTKNNKMIEVTKMHDIEIKCARCKKLFVFKQKIRSSHLYQIFAYVKNYYSKHGGNVSGLLLYAKTEEDYIPNEDFVQDGNRFLVRCLNLNQVFSQIKVQLNDIAELLVEGQPIVDI